MSTPSANGRELTLRDVGTFTVSVIDETAHPAASWLLSHGLPYHTELKQDLNGDGVDLLLAYALDLDPWTARAGLPRAVLEPGALSMSFHAAAAGITYTVRTSTDLQNWTTEGVVISDLGPDNRRTATVDRSTSRRFLRLEVAE